jgi:hypothetical protein
MGPTDATLSAHSDETTNNAASSAWALLLLLPTSNQLSNLC